MNDQLCIIYPTPGYSLLKSPSRWVADTWARPHLTPHVSGPTSAHFFFEWEHQVTKSDNTRRLPTALSHAGHVSSSAARSPFLPPYLCSSVPRPGMAALSRTVSSLSRRPQLASLQPARQMSSLFGHVEPAAKDPILGVTEAFLADQSPDNVNVGVVRAPLRSPRSLAVGLACLFWCFCSV
jgi:hypothetical protein